MLLKKKKDKIVSPELKRPLLLRLSCSDITLYVAKGNPATVPWVNCFLVSLADFLGLPTPAGALDPFKEIANTHLAARVN